MAQTIMAKNRNAALKTTPSGRGFFTYFVYPVILAQKIKSDC